MKLTELNCDIYLYSFGAISFFFDDKLFKKCVNGVVVVVAMNNEFSQWAIFCAVNSE